MLIKKFPTPTRIDYVPSPYEPDEDGVQDVGYKLGFMSDGRGYRLECWRMDDMLMITVMFSDLGLEGYKREDMALVLEGEGLVEFVGQRRPMQASRTTDDAGNSVWAINMMLHNNKEKLAELALELNSYRSYGLK